MTLVFGSRQLLHALDSISDKVAPSHVSKLFDGDSFGLSLLFQDEEAPMVMTAAFKVIENSL